MKNLREAASLIAANELCLSDFDRVEEAIDIWVKKLKGMKI